MMVRSSAWVSRGILATLFAFLASGPALATNGMNTIGYGAVSTGMGGADLALVDNATAMNINPAGICECAQPELGLGVSHLMPELSHRDSLGNDRDAEKNIFALPLVTFATPIDGLPLTFGIGLFSQGGMGAEYKGLNTPFGTRDDTFSNVMYAKVTPTLAWNSPGSRLRLGASLNAGYVGTDMKFFPDTSVAAAGFAGMDLKDLEAFGYGARLGFQYNLGRLTLGGAWLSKTRLNFDGGTMTLDFSDPGFGGLGKVDYDARMSGFNWPQQAGLGMSYRLSSRWRVAADVDWVDWSHAMTTVEIKLDQPENPGAPAAQVISIPMDWKDQWVYAVGLEYEFVDDWMLRVGYNHADSPVPDMTLSPLFPAVIEDHVTAGLGARSDRWQVDVAVEYALPASQENDNPDPSVNPFGIGSRERHSQVTTHLLIRRLF